MNFNLSPQEQANLRLSITPAHATASSRMRKRQHLGYQPTHANHTVTIRPKLCHSLQKAHVPLGLPVPVSLITGNTTTSYPESYLACSSADPLYGLEGCRLGKSAGMPVLKGDKNAGCHRCAQWLTNWARPLYLDRHDPRRRSRPEAREMGADRDRSRIRYY